jgi:hypothetical protein
MPSKPTISRGPKEGPAYDLLAQQADITTCETRDSSGKPKSVFVVGEPFKVHLDLIYPEVIADVEAAYEVRLICIQLAQSVGTGPYNTAYTGNLLVNSTSMQLDFDFTAQDPGTGPGIYYIIATLDFGAASQFCAWKFGNLFIVHYTTH